MGRGESKEKTRKPRRMHVSARGLDRSIFPSRFRNDRTMTIRGRPLIYKYLYFYGRPLDLSGGHSVHGHPAERRSG